MRSSVITFAAHAGPGVPAPGVERSGLPLWPPRVRGAGWRMGDGLGAIYATATVRPNVGEPHDLSLVDLDDGSLLTGRVVGLVLGGVRVGMRVRLAWDGELPVFVLDAATGATS